jgi:hypothetical protein
VETAWCVPAAPDGTAGTCAKIGAGGACTGSWQCPAPYVCRIPAGNTTGACAAGAGLGEACALNGLATPGGPFSDCADRLTCYPDATGAFRCGLGRELGQSCEDLPVGGTNPLSIPCRDSSCRLVGGKPTCVLDGKPGADCGDERPCIAGLICDTGKCRDPRVAVGQRCNPDGSYVCPEGSRCAMTGALAEYTCVAKKKFGEACGDPDDCVTGHECVNGMCLQCK